MTGALVAGESDPGTLTSPRRRRIKASPGDLREALRGRATKHRRFLLQLHLKQIDALDQAVAAIDQEAGANVEPFRTPIGLLTTIPGISDLSARAIAAEIGIDMCRFSTERHLISWAGLCESEGQAAVQPDAQRRALLNTTLMQCAWAAARNKGSYLQAQFHRLRSRRGAKKAAAAAAASMRQWRRDPASVSF